MRSIQHMRKVAPTEQPPTAAFTTSYSPRSDTNRKGRHGRTPQERRNQRARQEYARLLQGMRGHQCWFVTLTWAWRYSLEIRHDVWHILRTRLKQRWPRVEAWTTVEWAGTTGIHLHAVVKQAPDLSDEWLHHIMELLGSGVKCDLRPVYPASAAELARYLTKQIAQPNHIQSWPRGFHPFSATRGWCPQWVGQKQLRQQREMIQTGAC